MFPGASASPRRPFHVLTKPTGPLCNLDCRYCYYLKKTALYPEARNWRMSDHVLEAFIVAYIGSQDTPEVQFAWQGGEPTLLGVPFFEKVCALQRQHAGGKRITNALQTNGTLLDDSWGEFLHRERFLVGLSLDGPREFHDQHRRDRGDHPTWERVMTGLRVLQRHQVDYNLLTVVSATNAPYPREVYRFLRSTGATFLQFIPLVERSEPCRSECVGDSLFESVSPETVPATAWGTFLCGVFDEWIRRDVGRVFVQAFDTALAAWVGLPSPLCVHAETCGRALAIEHNGDVYACDHYVDHSHRRGNLLTTPLERILAAPDQLAFGRDKQRLLAPECQQCRWRFACHGGCPKHRFRTRVEEHPHHNHLCAGYRKYFAHIDEPMREMAALVRRGLPAERVMKRRRR